MPGLQAKSAARSAEWPRDVELALARFRLRAERRAAWLDALWRDGRGDGESALRTLAVVFEDRDNPDAESAWHPEWRGSKEVARTEAELSRLADSRWARLRNVFGLSPADEDLLQAAVAVALDPALARVCAFLNEHPSRTYLTESLAARVYGHGRRGSWSWESGAFRWDLVHSRETGPAEPAALVCDPQIRDWIAGNESLDAALAGVVALQPIHDAVESWPVDQVAAELQAALADPRAGRVQLAVSGPRGCGRRSFAAAVAARLGLPLLTVDCDRVDDSQWQRVFERAQRHAFLERTALAWIGDSLHRRTWPKRLAWFPVQFMICDPGQSAPALDGFVARRTSPPPLRTADRERLWRAYVPEVVAWPESVFRGLVERYRVTVGDITAAARLPERGPNEIRKSVRRSSRAKIGELATFLRCPFRWDDLILDPVTIETLKDIAFEAAHRAEFWENPAARRLFPQGRGLTALLSGPPGTGKTMSAQVVSGALGYDLFRVDLAAVVSKYVGETSQNIDRIFARARYSNAILLFDEADAMFAKRSEEMRDAQDRFANTDTAYLLQAIESYPGVVFLSTNQKGNIDPAFFRRLRFVVDYTKPDAAQRRAIWNRIVRELLGEEQLAALEPALDEFADTVEVTGAQIKNAVLGAVFIAKRARKEVAARELAHSLHRELSKHGRALGTRERERLSRHER